MKKYIRRLKWLILLDVSFYALSMICLALMPVFTKQMFDASDAGTLAYEWAKIVILFVCALIGHLLFAYLTNMIQWYYSIRFEKMIKDDYFNAIISRDAKSFYKMDVNLYVAAQSTDLQAIFQDYLPPMVDLVKSTLSIMIFTVIISITIQINFTIILIVLSFISIWIPRLTSKYLSIKREQWLKANKTYISKITDLFYGYNYVSGKTYKQFINKHRIELNGLLDKQWGYGRFKSLSLVINAMMLNLIKVVLFILTGYWLIVGTISIGTGVAMLAFVESFTDPLQSILYDFNALYSIRGVVKHFLETTHQENDSKEKIEDFNKIELIDVTVQLQDYISPTYNFTINRNDKYLVMGGNGVGKSTLFKILTKQLDIKSGRILVDDKDFNEVDLTDMIFYLDQKGLLLKCDYHSSVTIFNSFNEAGTFLDFQSSEIKKRILNCDDVTELSGGEQAIVKLDLVMNSKCPLVLIDEPFAALSDEIKKEVYQYLLKTNQTVLLISHDHISLNQKFSHVIKVEPHNATIKEDFYESN